jgi:hypothetical protein
LLQASCSFLASKVLVRAVLEATDAAEQCTCAVELQPTTRASG